MNLFAKGRFYHCILLNNVLHSPIFVTKFRNEGVLYERKFLSTKGSFFFFFFFSPKGRYFPKKLMFDNNNDNKIINYNNVNIKAVLRSTHNLC